MDDSQNTSVAKLFNDCNLGDPKGIEKILKSLESLKLQPDEGLQNLTPDCRNRVHILKAIQYYHDEIKADFEKEMEELEKKYLNLYKPLYEKRSQIVNGKVDVEDKKSPDCNNDIEGKGIPDFWLIAMKNNGVLCEEITEADEEALKFLTNITWSRLQDCKGFKLEFFFDPNPFFKNSVLMKTYHIIDEFEPTIEKAIGMEIEWHQGKCLTKKLLKKKRKKESGYSHKPFTKIVDCESFFNFFNPPQLPEDTNTIDEEDAEELTEKMDFDYNIAMALRRHIIPSAISFYTGEAIEEDVVVSDVDDSDEEGGGDDDDTDDDDNNDKNDTVHLKKREGGALDEYGRMDGEKLSECKQQ